MLVFALALTAFVAVGESRPNGAENVEVVPPNCLSPKEWVNNQCREKWRQSIKPLTLNPSQYLAANEDAEVIASNSDSKLKNSITVPPNCNVGQQLVNGICREVWRFSNQNIVVVPPNCPSGQELVNGVCREVWIRTSPVQIVKPNTAYFDFNLIQKNSVIVPPNCNVGQQLVNGNCLDIWRFSNRNIVTVPPNCPTGQELVNGVCREVWLRTRPVQIAKPDLEEWDSSIDTTNTLKWDSNVNVVHDASDINKLLESKNIISIPNHCPDGYKADALGFCREIFA